MDILEHKGIETKNNFIFSVNNKKVRVIVFEKIELLPMSTIKNTISCIKREVSVSSVLQNLTF